MKFVVVVLLLIASFKIRAAGPQITIKSLNSEKMGILPEAENDQKLVYKFEVTNNSAKEAFFTVLPLMINQRSAYMREMGVSDTSGKEMASVPGKSKGLITITYFGLRPEYGSFKEQFKVSYKLGASGKMRNYKRRLRTHVQVTDQPLEVIKKSQNPMRVKRLAVPFEKLVQNPNRPLERKIIEWTIKNNSGSVLKLMVNKGSMEEFGAILKKKPHHKIEIEKMQLRPGESTNVKATFNYLYFYSLDDEYNNQFAISYSWDDGMNYNHWKSFSARYRVIDDMMWKNRDYGKGSISPELYVQKRTRTILDFDPAMEKRNQHFIHIKNVGRKTLTGLKLIGIKGQINPEIVSEADQVRPGEYIEIKAIPNDKKVVPHLGAFGEFQLQYKVSGTLKKTHKTIKMLNLVKEMNQVQ